MKAGNGVAGAYGANGMALFNLVKAIFTVGASGYLLAWRMGLYLTSGAGIYYAGVIYEDKCGHPM